MLLWTLYCLQYLIIGYIHINIECVCFTLFLNGLRCALTCLGDMIVWLFKINVVWVLLFAVYVLKNTVAVFTGTEKQL